METTVDKPFVVGLRKWHIGLIHDLFSQDEVEKILNIPLSCRSSMDCRIWNYERNGKFSVRSAYHVARAFVATKGTSVSVCVWRACIDALPTKYNLSRWRVAVDNGCSLLEGDQQQFFPWLSSVAVQSSSLVFDLYLMTIWRLWNNRNDVVWNGVRVLP